MVSIDSGGTEPPGSRFDMTIALNDIVTREKIAKLEDAIRNEPGSLGENPFPLVHTFAPGLYARQVTCPAGAVIVTKIHKTAPLIFMLKGKVQVVTENGPEIIEAPCMFRNPVGVKRAVHVIEETVWINVMANPDDLTDMDAIEDRYIAKSYSELGLEDPEQVLELKGA